MTIEKALESSTGSTKPIPSWSTAGEDKTAIAAVPPPEGCVEPVCIMRNKVTDTARGTATTVSPPVPSTRVSLKKRPTNTAMSWPNTALRGWESGASGAPKSRTAVAPKDPNTWDYL